MDEPWLDADADLLEIVDTSLSMRARRMVCLIVQTSAVNLADNPVRHGTSAFVFDRALGKSWRSDQELLREVMSLAIVRYTSDREGVRKTRTVFLRELANPAVGQGRVEWRFGPGVAAALARDDELRNRLTEVPRNAG